jgi:hypothetical protein
MLSPSKRVVVGRPYEGDAPSLQEAADRHKPDDGEIQA